MDIANLDKEKQNECEKVEKPPKTLRTALPQILATSAKNLLLLGYGMTLGFPTIVIPTLQAKHANVSHVIKDVLTLTEDEISWFSSINLICVPLGCMVSGTLTQPLGRKKAMMMVNIPFIAAWLIFHYSSSVGMLYAGLVLSGLGGGFMEAPVLTYVAEITQPHLRGMLSATSSMCVILGVFIQFLMGTMFYWRTVALVNLAFPIAAIIALCFVPESPYWLVGRGRLKDAEKSLQWLRGWVQPPAVKQELSHIETSLAASKESPTSSWSNSWRNYTRRTFLIPYSLVSSAFFFGHFAGMTTLQTYSVDIFSTLGAPINKFVATLYLGLVQLAGTLVCVVLIHWVGKRPLTMVSTAGNGLCFIAVATYAYLRLDQTYAGSEWLPMTLLISAAFLSHACIRLLPWILIGEVYPPEVRGVASGASGSVGYIFGFAANKTYYHILHALTLPGTFWLYGGVSLLGTTLLFFFLPETEGRTLHDIQEHFAGKRNILKEGSVISRRRLKQQQHMTGQENPALELENMESRL